MLLGIVLVLLVLVLSWISAQAHDAPSGWKYPTDCCNGGDCMLVHVQELPGGYYIEETGELIEYRSLKIRPSGDSDFHICGGIKDGKKWTRCLYVTGGDV